MSAKEYYRPPPTLLPDLPPEIWLSIFRLATWSTDIFNPQLMVSAGCDTQYREQLRAFKRSLVTKRYLVRVCKAWYYLASPFLFEYIFLGRGRVLAPLRDGMIRSEHAVELQELPHAIGSKTQRLDVHIRDRTDNPGLIMDILADILRRLPKLRILTFAIVGHGYDIPGFPYFPENVLQATIACRDTLRFINWYAGVAPSLDTWASFLENHPRLEAVNAPVDLTLGNSHIVLGSLKSIFVYTSPLESHREDEPWNVYFPNIHHAIYDITQFDVFDYNNFLSKIGPKLRSIQVIYLVADEYIDLAFQNAFPWIVATCKHLSRVDVVTCKWEMPSSSFPETAHTLSIRVINAHQIPKRHVDGFFRTIRDFVSQIPTLKTICFMDQGNIRALRAHPQALTSNIARIVGLGVNVMDHEGRPF